jgi:hypothetical protein
LAIAAGHLGIETPDHAAIARASFQNASTLIASLLSPFVHITELRLGKMAMKSELMPQLLKMPQLRCLLINAEGSNGWDATAYAKRLKVRVAAASLMSSIQTLASQLLATPNLEILLPDDRRHDGAQSA